MGSTRQRILLIIQRRRSVTVSGLAGELGLAAATVRRHLDILQRDGLVGYEELRKKTGRPEHSFFLTEQGHESMPKGYDSLLSELVREFGEIGVEDTAGKTGSEVLNAAIARLGRRVGARYLETDHGPRAGAALQALRERDFEPEIGHEPGGTRITLRNCPFRSVALRSPAVCSYDTELLQTILGSTVRRERCISTGHDCCEYFADSPRPPSHVTEDTGGWTGQVGSG